MKCPKCGYNSFDYLDSCKKCNKDLTEHKARFNIQSILLSERQTEAISSVAEEAVAAATAAVNIPFDNFAGDSTEEEADDFGFDFMGDSEDDENLAFDELFEEVPSEDDLEETLPAPAAAAEEVEQESTEEATPRGLDDDLGDEFSFDETEPTAPDQKEAAITDSATEFGFDSDEDPAADIFAETEEDFSLDALDLEDTDKP